MIRTVGMAICLLFSMASLAQEPTASARARSSEVHLRAVVEAVVLLTDFSGEITPVDTDARFALTLRVESVEPALEGFASGAVVTLGIHSPSLLFAGEPRRGGTYDFYLHRNAHDRKARFFGLTSHRRCAEDDETVGYPLTGWVGYTNTGEPVSDMTVEALTSPDKRSLTTVKTDTAGRFSFPTLGPGRFYLKATKRLVGATVRADDVVTVRKGKRGIICLVADAEATDQSSPR